MQLFVHSFNLPLKNTFRIAHESRTEQATLIVELRDEAMGLSGLGEAPMTKYYGLDSAACTARLTALAPAFAPLVVSPNSLPQRVHHLLDEIAPGINPFLRCALDVAAHDLWAKQRGQRLGLLWEQDHGRRIPTCYTIGLGIRTLLSM